LHDYRGVFRSVNKGIRKELVPNLRLEITAAVPVLLETAPSTLFLEGVCCDDLFLPKIGAVAVSSGAGAGGLGSGIFGGAGDGVLTILVDRKHIIKCY
jgi:hypothetical protein|tara:strand:+ start:669 stop:962 length:294 start_codon:yes stop_codon:yes gene_type:complete